jgi:hypothetical protein
MISEGVEILRKRCEWMVEERLIVQVLVEWRVVERMEVKMEDEVTVDQVLIAAGVEGIMNYR